MSTEGDLDPAYVVRAVREQDFAAFRALGPHAGAGFTSLMVDEATLAGRMAASANAFNALITAPGAQRYMLALEHRETGALVGSAAVKATVGDSPPFFNFRVLTIAQASAAAGRRFDMDVLILVNEYTRASEVGSLFVMPEHRAGGVGRLVAQARYLLMAGAPQRFNPEVVSELRGVVSDDGHSPFWEHLGRHFFKMTFEEADRLSATTDNQFILDLMPKYPIYVDLLPLEAQAVIGATHRDGAGARRLLEWEGFRYDHVVDVFDGGPLMSSPRDSIRTLREAQTRPVRLAQPKDRLERALVATKRTADFRCVQGRASVDEGAIATSPGVLAALGLEPGEHAITWVAHA